MINPVYTAETADTDEKNLLLIFVKNPEPGKVKTRLAASIGEIKAMAVYKLLLQHTHDITSKLNTTKAVWYSDFIDNDDLWEDNIYLKYKQKGNDLGERMKNAFLQGFKGGFNNIVIIGSDCYQLTTSILITAFEFLNNHQVVIGPTEDGGYYLLGMKQLHADLFHNKKWSTSLIFKSTFENIKALNLKFAVLETLIDVDEEKDLQNSDLEY
jgi:uncharacterized protein